MGIGTTICTILYTVYVGVKVLLEAVIPLVFQISKQVIGLLIRIFTMINEVWKDISNLAVTLLAQFQKMLIDMLMGLLGNPFEKLCSNLWNCGALMLELLDGNSFLTRMLFRAAEKLSDAEKGAFECSRERYANLINYIKGVLNDFIAFKDIVCNFGFTTSFGVDELNSKVKEWQRMFDNWTKQQIAALTKVIDSIEGLEKSMTATGIFDYLRTLAEFGNCVLENTGICNEFATINNRVSDVCSKFNLKQNPSTGRFEFDKDFLNNLTKQFNRANSFCDQMEGLVDGLVSPGGSINEMFGGINYGKAYDITGFIKGAYDHVTSDDFSISKDWDNFTSSLSDTWDNIMMNGNLVIDNNLYAMGLYGIDNDIQIGDHEIRYYMPYQYIYKTDTMYELKYGVKDVTNILHNSDKNKFPTSYHEGIELYAYYPSSDIIKRIVDELEDDGFELYRYGTAYEGCYSYSNWVNLSNVIRNEKDYDTSITEDCIKLKECRGGIMLFLNCIVGGGVAMDNITNMDATSYEDKENGHSIGKEMVVFDGGVDLNSLYKKVIIGDKIVSMGTLALAMRDLMQGRKTALLEELGEEEVANSLELGKRWYRFMNVNVGELATRYA